MQNLAAMAVRCSSCKLVRFNNFSQTFSELFRQIRRYLRMKQQFLHVSGDSNL
ncbi:hypothetical protein PHMEG_00029511 [Phytophthora megakarya]|uniref:Uncharacterized protein n=1 Tax=Phytophthora megakarya TaxID=4795 RepID=A0A225V3E9_9STRA|nr:hypothetical protein PHMEG_00029511 [Phytophthora megakarya]